MNKRLEDPQEAFNPPEILEDSLEDGVVRCIAFNSLGTILAARGQYDPQHGIKDPYEVQFNARTAGLDNGKIALWDFEVRSIARTSSIHGASVSQVAWSKDGRLLASAASDGAVILHNIESDLQVGIFKCEHAIRSLSLSRTSPMQCLVSFSESLPQLINFETSSTAPIELPKTGSNEVKAGAAKLPGEGVAAILSHKGDMIYIALAKGFICIVSVKDLSLIDLIKVPQCTAAAMSASLSKNGKLLLVTYQDNAVRAFDVCIPSLPDNQKAHPMAEVQKLIESSAISSNGSLLNPDSPILKFSGHVFQDRVEKSPWRCAVPSSDLEYIAGASGVKNTYNIYIWTRWQRLDKVLEVKTGHGDSVLQLAWHPCNNLLAAVTSSGAIHLWAQVYKENWSAFAPDFVELQENEPYIEPEDIFDINPKPGADTQAAPDDMEVDIDILTLDKDTEVDSDGELVSSYFRHLPVVVQPQEFDAAGKLVVAAKDADLDSPAISSKSVSEVAISLGDGEVKREQLSKGKHRLANVTLPNGAADVPPTDEEDEAMLSD